MGFLGHLKKDHSPFTHQTQVILSSRAKCYYRKCTANIVCVLISLGKLWCGLYVAKEGLSTFVEKHLAAALLA